jgi:hypothetical protein
MQNKKLKPEQSLSNIDAKAAKALTKTQPQMDGEDFLADTPEKGKITKPNNKKLDGEKFLSTKEKKIKSFESFINENNTTLTVNGKIVKTYKQNGDSSYNVEYNDGTKSIIYSKDGWDEINDDDIKLNGKKFLKKEKKIESFESYK